MKSQEGWTEEGREARQEEMRARHAGRGSAGMNKMQKVCTKTRKDARGQRRAHKIRGWARWALRRREESGKGG